VGPAFEPGTVLAERYRLVQPLARGGMGSVWRAEHLTLSSEVAVKVIDPQVADLDRAVPRFLREARALAALHSPYIVQVIDFGSHGDQVYLVMELLEGKTLGQRLKAEGKLSAAETKRIFSDVCKAMRHAHERGIVHRDLKPDNIFLCDSSREHVTKVLDFGIAKPTGLGATGNTDTGAGTFVGTPSYMSPEQCRGASVDPRSDLWALGAIAYECLAGKRLFTGEAVGEMVIRICTDDLPVAANLNFLPEGFDAWLRKSMARVPDDRFQSAAQLFDSLSVILESTEPVRGVDSAETLTDRPVPPSQSSPASTLAMGALVQGVPPKGKMRAPLLLAAGSVGVAVVLSALALTRGRASPQLQEAGAASGELPARSSFRAANPKGPVNEAAPAPSRSFDAGAAGSAGRLGTEPARVEKRARRDATNSAARPAKRDVTRRGAPPDLDGLRRQR
jgi:serine/threonine protein kinase